MMTYRVYAFIACMTVCWAGSTGRADIWGGPLQPQSRLQPTYRAEQFVDALDLNFSPFGRPIKSPAKTTGTASPPQVSLDPTKVFLDLCRIMPS